LKSHRCLRSHEREIKERFAIRRIGLFGSFVRGEEKETSDVDILVEFEKPTFRNFMNLAFFLEDLFGRKVDLLTPEGISHRIRPYVEREVVWAD
jgi:predicted nucleotidyltransferase